MSDVSQSRKATEKPNWRWIALNGGVSIVSFAFLAGIIQAAAMLSTGADAWVSFELAASSLVATVAALMTWAWLAGDDIMAAVFDYLGYEVVRRD